MSYETVVMKLRSVPEQYLNQVSDFLDLILNQRENSEGSPRKPSGHPILGLAEGEFTYPDDINLYDDEIAEMFEV